MCDFDKIKRNDNISFIKRFIRKEEYERYKKRKTTKRKNNTIKI